MKNNRDIKNIDYAVSPISLKLRLNDSVSVSESIIVQRYIKRDIEVEIAKFLQGPEIVVLRGPRQSGKTTLLKKIGQQLVKKYGGDRVLLFTFEDDLVKDKFVKNPKQFVEYYLPQNTNKPVYFLFDEIQYVKQAGKLLKLIYDVYPQVRLVVTGSSTLDLNKLGQFLVGRAVYFELYPFSFAEFLRATNKKLFLEYQKHQFSFNKPKPAASIFIEELNQSLRQYLTYGGYPRVVLEADRHKKQVLLRNIYNTYVEKDVIELFGPKYKHDLLAILRYLGSTIGQMIKYQNISQITGVKYGRLKQTLEILKQTYLIRDIKPYHRNQVTELKKNPKFYFIDPGMRNVLLGNFKFDQIEYGHLLENYIFLQLRDQKIKYWRTTAKAEVDFILSRNQLPIEVKSRAKITRSLKSFIDTYQPDFAVVTDMTESEIGEYAETKIYTVPIALV